MSQNNIDDADLARRVCEHLAPPGEPTTPDDVRQFIAAHNRIAEERHAAIQERDAARKRIDELLVTVKNLSLSTPYPEEQGSAGVLLAEVGTLKARLMEAREELAHAVSENFAFNVKVAGEINEARQARDSLYRDVQRESARVNEMTGVIAHLVGVLAEVHHATSIENARTFAELALANIEAWHADAWTPGPSDDAADWKPQHWRIQ